MKRKKSGKGGNQKKRMVISIRFRYTLVFVGVLVAVIAALCLLNATQLERYTIGRKQARVEEAVNTIQAYVDAQYSDEASVELDRCSQNNNIDMIIIGNLDSVPYVLYATDIDQDSRLGRLQEYVSGQKPVATEIYLESDNYVIYRAYSSRLGSYSMDCVGILDGTAFMMSTPLESIRESVELSNRFLIMLGIVAALFGALVVYLITRNLTRPIQQLSKIAEEMSELDFNARYSGRRMDEIGLLGDSMNRMSDNLRQTIAELQEANRRLEEDLREKDRINEMRRLFLSNVSHELKTPIALIQGYSEGLKDGITEDPDSTEFYCDVIIDEAQKMNQIVKRLLNLDEIESGQMQLMRVTFDISEILRGVSQSSKLLAGDVSDVELSVETDENLYVDADEFMIEQVVQNYLSNAFHYVSHPGRVVVRSETHDGKVVVYVFNTGNQIPEDDIGHIWEKFYKVDKARTRSYGGSGIGLSIVQAIMKSHGERCGVRNCADGVEFWFELTEAPTSLQKESGDGAETAG